MSMEENVVEEVVDTVNEFEPDQNVPEQIVAPLVVTLLNGTVETWVPGQFTSYQYSTKAFVVLNGEELVAVYNMDAVASAVRR